MERKPINFIKNKDTRDLIEHVFDEGLGRPIILSAAPTTAGAELSENQMGFDGTNLFIAISGSIYQITLTAV